MSAQHTPGPWKALAIDSAGWVDIVREGTDDAWPLPFAACKHFDQEANARLIAAAPDLLEACVEARVRMVGVTGMERHVALLDAAISKATGQKSGS